MSREPIRYADGDDLSPEVRAQLETVAAMPDDQINTDDVPEITDWSGAVQGLFYRPPHEEVRLRVDADVLAWFQAHAKEGEAYEAAMNRALRRHVAEAEERAAAVVPVTAA